MRHFTGGLLSGLRSSVLILLILTAAITCSAQINVLTYHNDNARTAQMLNETILTPGNVNSTNFGKIGSLAVDGVVDAQPLYASNLTIAGAVHNVVFVVTEHDSVYAFDADTFTQLWHVTVLGTNETTSDRRNCDQVVPEIGITSTPVIDLSAGAHGTIFVVGMTKDGSGNYHQRLHALDLTTGAEQSGSPTTILATYAIPNTTRSVTFDPAQYEERASLLLMNGLIYLSWTSHCDNTPYQGWVMSYSESTFQQVSVLNLTPNGSGGAIWMSGGGLAGDSNGNIYALDGNGDFDSTLNAGGFPNNGDYGNAFLKLSTSSGLAVADYFEMFNQSSENGTDLDLGSGGTLLLPDLVDGTGQTRHLAVGAGKDQILYVVNRDSMGKFNPSNNNSIYQQINGVLPGGVWSVPAYFNNTVYYGPVGNSIRAFSIANARLSTSPTSQTAVTYTYPGASPAISANGSSNAILWAVENTSTAVLHAYNATNLGVELYNSNTAAGNRDHFGAGNKFITPMIANGKVFVGTATNVAVFGLLNGGVPQAATPTFSPAGGAITTSQPITISDSTPASTIYYTTNGTTPIVTPSEQYTGSFTLPASATVQAIAAASGYTNSQIASTTFTVGTSSAVTRVNAGGPVYTDSLSQSWSADTGFTGGSTSTSANTIANTNDPTLYRTERWGNFSYSFAAPAGSYAVTLKFAETSFTATGQRIFGVSINGTSVLSNFDIVAAAGGANTAVDRTFQVSSTGTITIQFIPGSADQPKVDAIQIVSAGVGVQINPTTATLLAGQTRQFTATVTGSQNTNVTWTMNPQIGTLDGTGFYTAPGSIATQQTVIVTATSVADTNQKANATVTLNPSSVPNGYAYTRAITIDHTKVPSTDQTNFPMLISGTYSYLATTGNGGGVTSTNGYDIIFTSDAGGSNPLSYERESYNSSNGAVNLWVKIPTLSHTSDTVIYLFYGNSSVTTDQSNKAAVWDSNFKGVYHLSDGTTLNGNDSTSNANDMAISGATATTGQVDGAAAFNGSDTSLSRANFSLGTSSLTVGAWVYSTNFNQNAMIANKEQTNANWTLFLEAGHIKFRGGNTTAVDLPSVPPNNAWHYLAGTISGTLGILYVDGVAQASGTVAAIPNTTSTLDIARFGDSGGGYYFNGKLDELRFSSSARSADWIATEYNNLTSTFYTVGPAGNGSTSPAITSANNATFIVGTLGSFTVTASGSPTPTLSESGALPSGVTFNTSTGVFGGTPSVSGSYPITFTAHNGIGSDAVQNFTLTVNRAPAITSANNATFPVGAAGSFTVTATGVPSPTLSENGALPSGVTFTAGTGVLAGTPATGTAGSYPITFTADNGVAPAATQNFTLTVNQAPVITSANNTTFTVGTAGTFTVTANGSPAPTFGESGALPSGVTFTAATGVLAGTPAAGTGGTYPITISASNGVAPAASQSFTLTVNQGSAITSGNATTFTVGTAGAFTVTATGFPAPTLSESGSLPAGVTFNTATHVLGGTPGASGIYPITFTAHNGVGTDATQNFTLNVNTQPAFNPIRVNSGGPAYTDSLSQAWVADTGFTGGSTATSANTIANTNDQTLYRTERWGNFSYSFAVPSGNYAVTLKFAETSFTAAGQRVFGVSINGTSVLSNFDIVAVAGGANIAVDRTFQVTSSGTITIQFVPGSADQPKVDAIQIASGGVGVQVSPTSATLFANETKQFTATVTGSVNTNVTWTMNPQVGTLDGTGFYTAPSSIATQQTVIVTATSVADTTRAASATVTLNPPPSLLSVSVNPSSVAGGATSTGTVTLTGPAPASGATVSISSSNTSVANVPASGTVSVAGGATTATFTITTSPVGSQTSVTITATYGATKTTTLTVMSINPIRVNSGGPAYTDSLGQAWAADTGFTGGSTYTVTTTIANTNDQTLYRSERWGSFSYSLAVAAGSRSVTLKFAETSFTAAGRRIFNVSINGTTVLTNFDIFAAAGAANTAVDRTFQVNSTGTITIQLVPGSADQPKIDAIQIQ